MFRRFSDWMKRCPIKTDIKTKRKRVVKEWISELGLNWCDLENVLFWKDPCVSLLVFVVFTAIFW